MQTILSKQLDEVFEAIQRRLSASPSLLASNCRLLHDNTHHVILIANQYDFRDIEANGLWTFSRLVLRFGRICLESRDVTSLTSLSVILLKGVTLCRQFASRDSNHLFGSAPEEFVSLLEHFKSLTPQLDVVYGLFCSFWLCQSMRRTITGFTTLMAIYSDSPNWWKSSRNLWDRKTRSETVAYIAQNATVEFVKSFWGLTESRLLRHALPNLRSAPKVCRDLQIPRQNQYVISGEEAKVEVRESTDSSQGFIRCRLLSNWEKRSLSIVVHIHGGGFVSQSPDSHETYLRVWSQRLSDSAIISVDYSLSPEYRYPTALQQVLDVYLWLLSENSEQELGFKVKDIVICGDSAGGNLSLALVLALHQMPVRSPKAVLCFYAPLMLQTRASASRLMTAVDTLLPLGVLLSCLEAYAPNQSQDFEYITSEDIPPDIDQWTPDWSLKWKHSFWTLRHRLSGQQSSKPWYREDNLEIRLSSLNAAANNAFVSPLLTDDMPDDVTLYLIGLHYDACLDDSIEMAKKWKGPVVLDVLDELPHGFLNFVLLSKEAERAADLCLDRIKQSLI